MSKCYMEFPKPAEELNSLDQRNRPFGSPPQGSGRRGRVDDGCIDDRARGDADAHTYPTLIELRS